MVKFLSIVSTLLVLIIALVVILRVHEIVPANIYNPLSKLRFTDESFYKPLSLDSFFLHDKSYIATLSADHIRIVNVTGDVLPARSVNTRTIQQGNFLWPWEKVYEQAKNADITYINLETPLISDCPPTDEGMIFCGDSRHIEGIVAGGVDIANLANNHTGNYGQSGIDETVQMLKKNGIEVSGLPNHFPVLNIRGLKFAFLGYTDIEPVPGVNKADKSLIKNEIRMAKLLADVVIVQMHWGTEYQTLPDQRQIELGHFIIDNGADIVIGNHPHWIQPVEIYKGRLITYAHGNFIFDQEWSQKTKEGVMGRYYFYDNQLIDVEYIPLEITQYGQANWITDVRHKEKILDEMYENSKKMID